MMCIECDGKPVNVCPECGKIDGSEMHSKTVYIRVCCANEAIRVMSKNRKPTLGQARKTELAILREKYRLNSESGFTFNTEGNLVNGQNRCHGIQMADEKKPGVRVKMYSHWHQEIGAELSMDQAKSRNTKDQVQIALGRTEDNTAISGINFMLTMNGYKNTVTQEEFVDMIEKYTEPANKIILALGKDAKGYKIASVVALGTRALVSRPECEELILAFFYSLPKESRMIEKAKTVQLTNDFRQTVSLLKEKLDSLKYRTGISYGDTTTSFLWTQAALFRCLTSDVQYDDVWKPKIYRNIGKGSEKQKKNGDMRLRNRWKIEFPIDEDQVLNAT